MPHLKGEKNSITSYCTAEENKPQLEKAYLLATERDFPQKLKTILERCSELKSSESSDLENNAASEIKEEKNDQAALLIGNSYILSTIVSLPDNIHTVYLCDLNQSVLRYALQLIQCAEEADNYQAFKTALDALNKESQRDGKDTNLDKPIFYTQEQWMKEKYLDEASFKLYKSKMANNKMAIHYNHINLFNKEQAKALTRRIREDNNKIALINYSNIHQLNCAKEEAFATLAATLKEVTLPQPIHLYSIYILDYNQFSAPELLYFKGCPQEHAKHLHGLHYFAKTAFERSKLKSAILCLGGDAIQNGNRNFSSMTKIARWFKNNKKKIAAGFLVGLMIATIAFSAGLSLIPILVLGIGATWLTVISTLIVEKCCKNKCSTSPKTADTQAPSVKNTSDIATHVGVKRTHPSHLGETPTITLQPGEASNFYCHPARLLAPGHSAFAPVAGAERHWIPRQKPRGMTQ